MKLLVFAHYGEAQSFINHLNFKPHNEGGLSGHLFTSKDYHLLITGEGPLEALAKCTMAGSLEKYTEIINMGLCGGLKKSLKVGDIYQVQTLYAHLGHAPLFHSYTTFHQKYFTKKKNLISSFERILNKNIACDLSVFAELVDREGYGVAKAAGLLGVKFNCYKIVSDLPISSQKELNLCEDIKEAAKEFSEQLFEFFKQNINEEKNTFSPQLSDASENKNSKLYDQIIGMKNLHFTFSMSKKLKKTLNSLELKYQHDQITKTPNDIVQLILKDILKYENENQKKLRSKDRASFLIEKLAHALNPFKYRVDNKINKLLKDFPNKKIRLNTDPSHEREGIGLNSWIQSEEDIKELADSLKEIPIDKLLEIQRGQHD